MCIPRLQSSFLQVLYFQLSHNGPSALTAQAAVGSICVLVDNSHVSYHTTNRCQVRNAVAGSSDLVAEPRKQVMELRAGYHLLRAFLIYSTGECVKESSAYVEGEFFVGAASVQVERHDHQLLSCWALGHAVTMLASPIDSSLPDTSCSASRRSAIFRRCLLR